MSLFKKKTFYPPVVAETTIGNAGTDLMFILNKKFGYGEAEDTYQEAWSEYMKVQYALTLMSIAAKTPSMSEDFAYFLENAMKARIEESVGVDILVEEVIADSWYKDVSDYRAIGLDKIPGKLYSKLLPLIPFELNEVQKTALLKYLEQRIPFIYSSLAKLKFGLYMTRAESDEFRANLKKR